MKKEGMSNTGKEIMLTIEHILKSKKGTVLDVGVGNREKTLRLQNMGLKVYGCDIALEPGIDIPVKIDFFDASKDKFPYKDGFFDAIVCTEVFEHLRDYHHPLEEFNRVMKKRGDLIVSTPNVSSLLQRMNFLFTGKFRKFNMPPDHEFGHITPIPLYILKDRLEYFGFKIEKVYYLKNIIPLLRIKVGPSIFFSDNYLIHAIKK